MELKDGINHCTNREYHADKKYLSSSSLKLILESPAEFYKQKILGQVENKESNVFDEGSLTHSLILEPHKVAQEFAFYEGLRKQGADFEKFKAANPAKIIMSKPQKERCDYFVRSYKQNPIATSLISGGESEHTVCVQMDGVGIKVRADYINVDKGYMVDIKTSGYSVDRDSFLITIDQYKYNLSAALYMAAMEQHYGRSFDFYFVVICKKEADCQVFKVSEVSKRRGIEQVKKAIALYKKCKDTGIWENTKKELISSSNFEVLEV